MGLIDLVYVLLGIVLCYALFRLFCLVLKKEKQVFDNMEKKDGANKNG